MIWLQKMLPLSRLLINGENVSKQLAFAGYRDCVLPPNKLDEALRCVSAVSDCQFCQEKKRCRRMERG